LIVEEGKMAKMTTQQDFLLDRYWDNHLQAKHRAKSDFQQKQALFLRRQEDFRRLQQDFQRRLSYFSHLHQELQWQKEDLHRCHREQKQQQHLRHIPY
jgi:uncharacterized protein with von Willebrand factor type A (vWA) domain